MYRVSRLGWSKMIEGIKDSVKEYECSTKYMLIKCHHNFNSENPMYCIVILDMLYVMVCSKDQAEEQQRTENWRQFTIISFPIHT